MKLSKLSDIFSVSYGTKLDMNKMSINSNSEIAFVSRSSKNNGIVAYVNKYNDILPLPAGLITVTLGGTYVLSSFLQELPFYTAQNVAVLEPKQELSIPVKLYYCMCIAKNRFRYSAFGREANRTLKDVFVPAIEEIPGWINDIDINQFSDAGKPYNDFNRLGLSSKDWRDFEYQELFEIERGKGPRKKDLDGTGDTPVVTSSDKNNGWTSVTAVDPIHEGNTIGVNRNGSVAEAFYQPIPFCSTEDVHIFKPKFKMNKYIGLFMATLIRREKYRYNYGRKWGIARMKVSKIKLPVDTSGEPDFAFMENFIKMLPFSRGI